MQVMYEKSQFSINISLHRVLTTVRPSGVINRVLPPDRGKFVTHIAGVCVQHSREAHLTVLLWPFVTARYHGITNKDLHMPHSKVLFRMT